MEQQQQPPTPMCLQLYTTDCGTIVQARTEFRSTVTEHSTWHERSIWSSCRIWAYRRAQAQLQMLSLVFQLCNAEAETLTMITTITSHIEQLKQKVTSVAMAHRCCIPKHRNDACYQGLSTFKSIRTHALTSNDSHEGLNSSLAPPSESKMPLSDCKDR